MLTERQNKILKLIVEKYIKEPIPVGSKVISKAINCSSATVRNEMGELEKKGLLEKTHTSSGRIPSEAGYRYYVDNLMELKKMNAEDMLKLQIVFRNQQLALSDVITKSLQVISDMMNYTTVVLGSKSHENLLKQIEVIPIDDENLTVIIVTDKGHVEHKNIRLKDVSLTEVKKTVGLINNLISGTPIDDIVSKLEFEVKPIIGNYVRQHEQLYNAFYNVFTGAPLSMDGFISRVIEQKDADGFAKDVINRIKGVTISKTDVVFGLLSQGKYTIDTIYGDGQLHLTKSMLKEVSDWVNFKGGRSPLTRQQIRERMNQP